MDMIPYISLFFCMNHMQNVVFLRSDRMLEKMKLKISWDCSSSPIGIFKVNNEVESVGSVLNKNTAK